MRKKGRRYERTYGITIEEYMAMTEQQQNLCALCGGPPQKKALAVDHDHDTGRVRELLCLKCNAGLGSFNDDLKVLRKAVAYLEKHSEA